MNKISTPKMVSFFVFFGAVTIAMNVWVRPSVDSFFYKTEKPASPPVVVAPPSIVPISQPLPETPKLRPSEVPQLDAAPKHQPAKPKIWPTDYTPTLIIKIPDPVRPTTGVMDLVFKPGDDVQFDIEPMWNFTYPEVPRNLEIGGDKFDLKARRSARFRSSPNARESFSMRLTITHEKPKEEKPYVPTFTKFGPLTVSLVQVRGLNGNAEFLVDLVFENTSRDRTLAVALRGPRGTVFGETALLSKLIDSGGVEFWAESISGLQVMHAIPARLTAISPLERRNVSIKYRTTWSGTPKAPSIRLQMEIVLKEDFRDDDYANYKFVEGVTPPGCKVENIVWNVELYYEP